MTQLFANELDGLQDHILRRGTMIAVFLSATELSIDNPSVPNQLHEVETPSPACKSVDRPGVRARHYCP